MRLQIKTDELARTININQMLIPRPIIIALVSACFVSGAAFFPDYLLVFIIALTAVLLLISKGDEPTVASVPARIRSSNSKSDSSKERNALADALQHPVFIVDQAGIINFANTASKNVFEGVRTGEQIFTRFRNPELRRTIENAISDSTAETLEYHQRITGDRWFNVEIAPIPSEDSKLFAISFHDFSESKRIDQMRSDFIANASHELRTPLASLIGYLETLKGPAKNDPKASERFVEVMLDQSERMTRLVNDLLSLSGIEMKSHVKPSKIVDLMEIIRTVVDSLDKLARQMGVEILISSDAASYRVLGDRDELVQVFENLVENGCKYGDDGGRVEIDLKTEASEESSFVTVSVRDFGPGIPLEHQHRITERFYRVDVARSREKQGTGLGLAIVKHILQRHGTRLVLNPNLDEGAEFSVKLPLINSV